MDHTLLEHLQLLSWNKIQSTSIFILYKVSLSQEENNEVMAKEATGICGSNNSADGWKTILR